VPCKFCLIRTELTRGVDGSRLGSLLSFATWRSVQTAHTTLQTEGTAAATAAKNADTAVHVAARAAMVEYADSVASALDAALTTVFDLEDELQALAMLSVPDYAAGESWQAGAARRVTTAHENGLRIKRF
jgi:hypothetical protein